MLLVSLAILSEGRKEYQEMREESHQTRSYLYGRLLAIYEGLEEAVLRDQQRSSLASSDDSSKKSKIRATNALRYWNSFVNKPDTTMKTLELEVAAEYLVMASTLLEIKARMLLPKPKLEELDEDGEPIVEDPRDQLVQQLLEYQQIKENAKKLEELSFLRGLHFGKEASDLSSMQEIIPLKEGEVTTQDLWNALKKLARKNIAKMPLKANIQHETHTVEELMDSIISKIEHTDKKQVPFEECFPAFNRHAITTTFLAMLQLVREHRVRFIQSSPYEDILIEKRQEKEKESD